VKKNIIKVLVGIIVLILFILIILFLLPQQKKSNNNIDKEKLVTDVIENVFYNSSSTKEDIQRTIGSDIPYSDLFLSKDSYLRDKPSSAIIKSEKLDKYVKLQNKCAENVEKRIKENTSYKITNKTENKISLEVIPWYYSQYTSDVKYLKNKIYTYTNYTFDENDLDTKQYEVIEYKARVIAMNIIDSNLDTYDNTTNETRNLSLTYNGSQPEKFDYFTLYLVLGGSTAEKGPSLDKQDERINMYINNAIDNKIFNKNKPLDINNT